MESKPLTALSAFGPDENREGEAAQASSPGRSRSQAQGDLERATPLSLARRLEALRRTLVAMDESAAIAFFRPKDFDRLLKTTISLCPDCLGHVPALVFTSGGRVLMAKLCGQHGRSEALLENDESFYHLSNKDRWGRRFSHDKVIDFPAFTGGCGAKKCGGGPGDG